MPELASTPRPPYVVVVFTSQRSDGDDRAYDEASARMSELVEGVDGYLGRESVRGPDGFGITVSYWRDEDAVRRWQEDLEHRRAQGKGKAAWYTRYALRVGRIERDSGKAWKDVTDGPPPPSKTRA